MVISLALFNFLLFIDDSDSFSPLPSLSHRPPALLHSAATDVDYPGVAASGVLHYSDGGAASISRAGDVPNLFRSQLNAAGLSSCHGILHASGCRRMSDLRRLTPEQLSSMGAVESDRAIMDGMSMDYDDDDDDDKTDCPPGSSRSSILSTIVGDGVYSSDASFDFEVICAENEIFKGRLFTLDQCNMLKRMSEYHAYDTVNSAWRGMACKTVPGFVATTDHTFRRLLRELYSLYPGILRGGEDTIRFESDSEPHLVKYNGMSTGSPLHVDTDHRSITINVLLSDADDFGGGGTYIRAIDRTIMLEQGQMLIHPGCLAHAGADITYGVRQLLVAFVECEWEDVYEETLRSDYREVNAV